MFFDGGLSTNLDIDQETIIKGDSKILSISFASIFAKVSRDIFMIQQDSQYAGYDFSSHKGYGTKAHRECISEKGFTPLHRKTFCRNILIK